MSTKMQVEVVEASVDQDQPPKEGGLTWWSDAACAVLLLTIAIPLFFDSMMMKFLAVADGTAATGLALAMIAAAIAYFSSGRLRRVMNFTLTATALEMTTFSIGVTAGAHSAAVKREAERLAKGVEHAQQVVILHWMRELERGPMDCTTRWQGTA